MEGQKIKSVTYGVGQYSESFRVGQQLVDGRMVTEIRDQTAEFDDHFHVLFSVLAGTDTVAQVHGMAVEFEFFPPKHPDPKGVGD